MFLVQADHGELAIALGGIVQPPPVCVCSQEGAGILMQAIVELVAEEPAHDHDNDKHGPELDREMEKALSKHIFFFLFFSERAAFPHGTILRERAEGAVVSETALFTRS